MKKKLRVALPLSKSRQFGFVGDCEFDQRVEAMQIESYAYVRAVMIDRANSDEERFGDLFAGFPVADHFQDATFGGRQVIDAGFMLGELCAAIGAIEQISRQSRTNVVGPGGDGANAVDDLVAPHLFQ